MAISSLTNAYAYQRTSQTQHTWSATTSQGGKGDVAKSGHGKTGMGDLMSVADPVAFANRVMQDKVAEKLKAINDELAKTPGAQLIGAVDPAQVTPEGTANFIVSTATGFMSAYLASHKGESGGDKDKLDNFMKVIKGGIDKGFKEARGILDAVDALKGTVGSNVDKTYDLVQQGLDSFYKTQMDAIDKKGQDQGSGLRTGTTAATSGAKPTA